MLFTWHLFVKTVEVTKLLSTDKPCLATKQYGFPLTKWEQISWFGNILLDSCKHVGASISLWYKFIWALIICRSTNTLLLVTSVNYFSMRICIHTTIEHHAVWPLAKWRQSTLQELKMYNTDKTGHLFPYFNIVNVIIYSRPFISVSGFYHWKCTAFICFSCVVHVRHAFDLHACMFLYFLFYIYGLIKHCIVQCWYCL